MSKIRYIFHMNTPTYGKQFDRLFKLTSLISSYEDTETMFLERP